MNLKILLFMFCLPAFCFGQRIDSVKAEKIEKNSGKYFKPSGIIVPSVFIGYGLLSLVNGPIRNLDLSTQAELQEDHPLFAAHIDNYLQFAPAAAFYGLNLAGIKGKHTVIDASGRYLLAEVIMTGTVSGLKKITNRMRPDGSANNSFPSGHTANAFAAAEFLSQEYKESYPWIGYAGYTVATATGVLRLYNNRHWLSDVVAGAGFGILSTKVAYLIYPGLKRFVFGKQNSNYNLLPAYQSHSIGFSFNGKF
ncbi:membrane-associated phospholipid phosphatase [Pedobacter sp. UYP24]